jgi:hypothetical protein
LLDFYGGITLDSWAQTLQGAEMNAPGQGFFGQNRHFSADPTVGLGVRMPVGDIGADLPIIFGVDAELQFRPGSVVTAPSPNFPVTYFGTVDPHANLAIMARYPLWTPLAEGPARPSSSPWRRSGWMLLFRPSPPKRAAMPNVILETFAADLPLMTPIRTA